MKNRNYIQSAKNVKEAIERTIIERSTNPLWDEDNIRGLKLALAYLELHFPEVNQN